MSKNQPTELAHRIAAQIGNIFDDDEKGVSNEEHRRRVDCAAGIAQQIMDEAQHQLAIDVLRTIQASCGTIAQESGTDILWWSSRGQETLHDYISGKLILIAGDQPLLPIPEREPDANEFLSLLVGGYRFTENEIRKGVAAVRADLADRPRLKTGADFARELALLRLRASNIGYRLETERVPEDSPHFTDKLEEAAKRIAVQVVGAPYEARKVLALEQIRRFAQPDQFGLAETAKAIIREHENLEDQAPVDPECGDCNLGTGPHKKRCAYHAAKRALREFQEYPMPTVTKQEFEEQDRWQKIGERAGAVPGEHRLITLERFFDALDIVRGR